jgi:DNA (cytosine-5)-methyltransferase 1
MRHGSLFSGIGGFDLAAQWMGWSNVFHVERDPFCQRVLRHHFPQSESYEDIKEFDGTAYAGRVDIISGGFPCQPFSAAGKRGGTSDDRYLWPEMFRVIRQARPAYVVAENVRGLISWNNGLVLDTVCADLEGEGYEVFPVVLPAASVNAPHRRDRIWIVATNADGSGRKKQHPSNVASNEKGNGGRCLKGNASDADQKLREQRDNDRKTARATKQKIRAQSSCGARDAQRNASHSSSGRRAQDHKQHAPKDHKPISPGWIGFPTVSPICSRDDGLSLGLDGITLPKWRRESLKAYGNAIVPQVALQIFRAIEQDVQGSL